MPWEHIEHDADIGVRGIGNTVEEAFAMAGVALTAIIMDPAIIPSRLEVKVNIEAPELELLLVDWLNSIIYEMDTKHLLFSEFKVKIENNRLEAILQGEKMENLTQDFGVDIKGATYTELKVAQEKGLWIAQCVLDV